MLKLSNISKYYWIAGRRRKVLSDVNLEINPGEIIAITGKSGSGKTTLLNIIAGLTHPSHGKVHFQKHRMIYLFDWMPAHIRNRKMGFIFQIFRLLSKETVASNVLMPARIRGLVTAETHKRLDEILEKLGIAEYKHTKVAFLSGGQKQRVAIARALINNPPLILADEPTANLDKKTALEIYNILEDLAVQEKKAIIIVTHSDYMFSRAHKVWKMENGILEVENAEKIAE